MFFTLLFLGFLLMGCQSFEQNETLKVDLKEEIVQPNNYVITRTQHAPVIDGKGNELSWEKAVFSSPFIDIEGKKKPKYKTQVKMLWDPNYLYVYAVLEEPHIWGNLRERDTVIYYNNDFEIFVSPSGTTRNYGEIEINCLGTVWDLMLDRPYRDQGRAINQWNLNGLKSAVQTYGTVNDPNDIDSLWTIEIAIPLPALLSLKKGNKLPREGEQWRMNFSRVEWNFDLTNNQYARKKDGDGNFLPEYNWVWSNQNTINMHEPEKWGYVQFTRKASAQEVKFLPDRNDTIKQIAYALYRKTKFGSLRSYLEKTSGYSQKLKIYYGVERPASAQFYKTNYGFEYRVQQNDSSTRFLINDSGIIKNMP
ncbi:MAG: carbohydrate-binding family 9-like protein [Flavobacteriaceae bacterium]